MNSVQERRGAAPVGYLAELDGIEAASVIYLRLWTDGLESREKVVTDFSLGLGDDQARNAIKSFQQLCTLCSTHGRRPLMRHSVECKCLGADESCFANFIATAAEGDREDAMLFATLLVRVDMAPLVTACAVDFGLALKRMRLSAPRDLASINIQPNVLH